MVGLVCATGQGHWDTRLTPSVKQMEEEHSLPVSIASGNAGQVADTSCLSPTRTKAVPGQNVSGTSCMWVRM